MVIALASRALPERQRRIAVMGGSAAAVVLRIVFCLIITTLLRIPYLKIVGGLLLLYIGVKLVIPEGDAAADGLAATANVWDAIQTILIADAVMSLDNVVAIAAAAHDSVLLITLGLVIGIPMIVFGSQLLLRVLSRFPILVILVGGLIGWIAGDILVSTRPSLPVYPSTSSSRRRLRNPSLRCRWSPWEWCCLGGRRTGAPSWSTSDQRTCDQRQPPHPFRPTAPRRREGLRSTCSTLRREGWHSRSMCSTCGPRCGASPRSSPTRTWRAFTGTKG